MRIWIGVSVVLILIFLSLASWTSKREFVAPCTLTVTGKTGDPLANIRVSESWNAYSYDLAGGFDIQTDAHGRAIFPAQSSTHSALFWALRPIQTRFNYGAHASSGTTATIGVSEPGLKTEEGDLRGFTCSNTECTAHPLEFVARLVSK